MMRCDSKTRYNAVQEVIGGATLREAAHRTGVSHEAVRRWCLKEGVVFLRGPSGGAAAPRKRGGRPGGAPKRLRLVSVNAFLADWDCGGKVGPDSYAESSPRSLRYCMGLLLPRSLLALSSRYHTRQASSSSMNLSRPTPPQSTP